MQFDRTQADAHFLGDPIVGDRMGDRPASRVEASPDRDPMKFCIAFSTSCRPRFERHTGRAPPSSCSPSTTVIPSSAIASMKREPAARETPPARHELAMLAVLPLACMTNRLMSMSHPAPQGKSASIKDWLSPLCPISYCASRQQRSASHGSSQELRQSAKEISFSSMPRNMASSVGVTSAPFRAC